MIHGVEELREVEVDRIAITFFARLLERFHRLMRAASGSEPVTVLAKKRFPLGAQHLADRLLDESILDDWKSQRASATVGFLNLDASHGCGQIVAWS